MQRTSGWSARLFTQQQQRLAVMTMVKVMLLLQMLWELFQVRQQRQ
jgi:hypothetical protein